MSTTTGPSNFVVARTSIRDDKASLLILNAHYMTPNVSVDVTDLLQSMVENDSVSVFVSNSTMGGDPDYGVVKTLRVEYLYGGEFYEVEVWENDTLQIP